MFVCNSTRENLTLALSVAAKKKTLIVPDKDADGLTSGVILLKTLMFLGLPEDMISVHLMQKGSNIHEEEERKAMEAHNPSYVFVLDQGSRKSPPVVDNADCRVLLIDHHWAPTDDDFPQGAEHVTACLSPPVATSSMLTYHLCCALHARVVNTCAWLCAVGTHGDLGSSVKWEPPFPDMGAAFKEHTRKAVNGAVSLLNAPRRTASYNVRAAWDALAVASSPKDVLSDSILQDARVEVNAEVLRCARAPPKFSADGRVAVIRINSAAQVHPVIATRWAGHLQSPRLEIVLVANEGYLPGKVNFSCRVARCAKGSDRDVPVDIIEVLREYADAAQDPTLRARLGESFARGHKEASGGIVPKEEFEEFMAVLDVGWKKRDGGDSLKQARVNAKSSEVPKQSNTLTNYFKQDNVSNV